MQRHGRWQRWRAGHRQRGQQRGGDDVAVARRAQQGEGLAPGGFQRQRSGRVWRPGRKHAQGGAQATQGHAQLVQVFRRGRARRQLGRIGQRLRQRADQHLRQRVRRRAAGWQRCRQRLDGRHAGKAQGQAIAAFRLGAHVPPQTEAPGPTLRQVHECAAGAANQLEFDLVNERALLASHDVTAVVGDFDQRALVAHAAVQAADVGAVDRQQRRADGLTVTWLRRQ